MQDKLRAAFSQKEKAEVFLANLEKLKEDKGIGDAQYRVLSIEYKRMREEANGKISSIKASVKQLLNTTERKAEVVRQELGYLEARHKVGELASNIFFNREKAPRQKLAVLEKQIEDLNALLNATDSNEIGTSEPNKVLGLNLGFGKKTVLEQPPPLLSNTQETARKSTIAIPPPVTMPQTQSVPSITPPPPPPPPPPITVGSLKIMPQRVAVGGSVGVITVVTNITMAPVQQDLLLKVNGEIQDSRLINLYPGESQELTFVAEGHTPGNNEVDINGIIGHFMVVPLEIIRNLQ